MAVTLSKTPIVPAHNDAELVAATRAGEDRAFEQLYARYRERIFAFVLGRVRDHGRAEDIVQDVFISALRRLRATDQAITFKPWVYEIAKNACIDEFRRGTRAREVSLEPDGEVPTGAPTTLSLVPTPIAAVESRQRMSDLKGAFGGLSESHHQLLVLREFEGLSYDEIGQRLDMSRQMVESGLFRARRKLSEEYRELASGRRCAQVQLAIDTGVMSTARSLGVRDRRRYARHLSHCQACRYVALQAGVDESLVRPRRVAARIAALLPLPLRFWRWPWSSGSGGSAAQPVAGSALGLGPVALTAAALTLAGVGGTLAHGALDAHSPRPVTAVPAAAIGSPLVVSPARPSLSAGSTGLAPSAGAGATMTRAGGGAVMLSMPATSVGRAGSRPAAPSGHGSSTGSPRSGAAADAVTDASSLTTSTVAKLPSLPSTVQSTVQNVASTTERLVSGTTRSVTKVAGTLTKGTASTVQGLVNTVGSVASGSSTPAHVPSTAPSPPSTAPSGSSTLSTVTQPLGQAVQTVEGLLPK